MKERKEREKKRKWKTEECLHRGRYSKCWLEWSLVRRIILRVFSFSILFRQGVQTIAVCFRRDGITNVYFLPNQILTKTIPLFYGFFFSSHGVFVRSQVSKDGNFLWVLRLTATLRSYFISCTYCCCPPPPPPMFFFIMWNCGGDILTHPF